MKKILLAVSALFLVSAVFAQGERIDVRKQAVSAPAQKVQLTGFEEGAVPQTLAPITRATNRAFVGMTYYDLQTNGSMAPRIVTHTDGTMSAIWTTNGSTASSRGTGYNYYNGSSWINSSTSTDRIENVRTGWGTITCVGDAEIVASHNGSNALVIAIRPNKGTGDWTFSTLQGPAASDGSSTSTCLLWPAIASSGNTIHLIACTESDDGFLYQGIQTCLVYYRGTFNPSNNTISWENPRVVGDVTSADVARFQGDGYAIAAKDNTVAIVACPGSNADAFIWKSTDNGVNFTKTVFWECAIKNGNLAPMMDTTIYVVDGSCAVAIGDDGHVHVATGAYLVVSDVDTGDSWYWYPGVGYLFYWNDSQAPITYNGDNTYLMPEVLKNAGYTVIERFNLDCDTSIWGLSSWGIDAYPSYGVGSVSFPQVVAEGGNVYLTFCQLMEYPFIDNVSEMYFRGVFATKSTNNGQSFGDYSWLSYNNNCYYLTDWSLFPIDDQTSYEDIAQFIEIEGESVFPAVAPKLRNGKLVMTWQQDFFAGSEIKEASVSMSGNESSIFYFELDANEVGVYNNVHEVCQGMWVDSTGINNRNISGMKMYPNPAENLVNITFSAENAENGVVSVMNLMGQTVYTANLEVSEGYNMITVPVKQLTSGIYMVTLQTNTGISTQKLIVK
jgi:CBS domain-containing protein